jgi:hypothetical protein
MHPIVRMVFAAALLPSTSLRWRRRRPDGEPARSGARPTPAPSVPYVVITDRKLPGPFAPLIHARTRAADC